MPSEASRRSFFARSASSTDGTTTSAGYTRSARSHSRSRPTRPAIAISPRIIRNSSIWVTLRLFVHPVEAHGTTHVSGMSRERQRPGAAEQLQDVAPEAVVVAEPGTRRARSVGQSAAPARYRPRSLIGRISASSSNSVRSCSRACLSCVGLVRRAEPAPGDEVGARRDRRGRVDLQQGQPLHDGRAGRSAGARRAAARAPRCAGPAPWSAGARTGGYVRVRAGPAPRRVRTASSRERVTRLSMASARWISAML